MVIIVGLPDAAVKESRDRVKTAIENSGFKYASKKVGYESGSSGIQKGCSDILAPPPYQNRS